jgi:hypothetical protein
MLGDLASPELDPESSSMTRSIADSTALEHVTHVVIAARVVVTSFMQNERFICSFFLQRSPLFDFYRSSAVQHDRVVLGLACSNYIS